MATIVGSASAAATSVALPAHQLGDLIIVSARRASNTAPATPAASAVIPAWRPIQTAGANTLALKTVYAVASGSNHQSGVFTNASHICAIVLRPTTGNVLTYVNSSTGNAVSTLDITYPALTFAKTDGTSFGVRIGTRGVASSALSGTPWELWSNTLVQPAGAGALMTVHTLGYVGGNAPTDTASSTVSTPGTAAPYRAHTIEISEQPPSVPTWEDSIDNFNRADAKLNAGAGANLWILTWLSSNVATDLRVISNQLGSVVTDFQPAHSKAQLDNSAGNCDAVIDCVVAPTGVNSEFSLWFLIVDPSTTAADYYGFIWTQGNYLLRRYLNTVSQGNIAVWVGPLNAGDTLWFQKRGSALKCYRKVPGGIYIPILSAVDANHNPVTGTVGVELSDTSQRWDNLRGGPLIVPAPGNRIVTVV